MGTDKNPNVSFQPTWVVELTPRGRAAVAVVMVAGPDAVRAVDECFLPASGRALASAPANHILLGRWGEPGGEELIASRRSTDVVEIHCHGGAAAVRGVVERLRRLGCEPLAWHEWLHRTAADPIRAAAQVALADAPTARTAAILLDQLHGALATEIGAVLYAAAEGNWAMATARIDAMLAHRGVGLHLTVPWRVVLTGRPNVGKSSLMNAIVGYQRAIVCELPGTTRDVVTTATAIDGWPIQLADTAGLREPADELESAGVERARAALAEADLIVVVDDVSDRLPPAGIPTSMKTAASVASYLPCVKPRLNVWNKIDLVDHSQNFGHEPGDILTSAVTSEGIDTLVAEIGRALVPVAPAAGAAVPFTAEQIDRLQEARTMAEHHDANAVAAILKRLLA